MHGVVVHVLRTHRLEGAGADVKGHVVGLHAARGQCVEHGLVEMQAGGRGGHGASLAGEHGLVAVKVSVVGIALDVGRQRHAPHAQQQLLDGFGSIKSQAEELAVTTLHHQPATVAEFNDAAFLGLLADAELRTELVVVVQALDQDLHGATGFLVAIKARGQHAGVVEHQQVTGLQQLRQIAELAVVKLPGRHVEVQQARRTATGQRALRDQLGRQREVEIGFLQSGYLEGLEK